AEDGIRAKLVTGVQTCALPILWVPLAEPTPFQIDLEVGKQRVVRQRVRLVPPRRWTLYWLASSHTDLGLTDLRERCVELHRRNQIGRPSCRGKGQERE